MSDTAKQTEETPEEVVRRQAAEGRIGEAMRAMPKITYLGCRKGPYAPILICTFNYEGRERAFAIHPREVEVVNKERLQFLIKGRLIVCGVPL